MGFSEKVARDALRAHNGDVERAIDSLLSPPSTITTDGGNSGLITSSMSQYSFPEGRSACTFIALAGVQILLPEISETGVNGITPELLEQSIIKGVETYNERHATPSAPENVEHSSPEEAMIHFPEIEWVDETVLQGIMGGSPEMGLLPLLSSLQHDREHMAVVITKPPETVLALLPPSQEDTTLNNFLLMDSHPRSFIAGGNGSYIQTHASLQDLVNSLERIFPPVQLGDDSLNIMYNSFDLYLLRCQEIKKNKAT